MPRIFVSTDLHLWSQDNDNRHPYRTQRQIDDLSTIFANTLNEGDILIFLGDICDPEAADIIKLSAFVRTIPCAKHMCRGNHDTEDDSYYLEAGFDTVQDIIRIHNIIFSHKPVKVAPDEINIHGHLHTEKLSGLSYQHINAYGARWNEDGPLMLLDDLIASATVQRLDTGEREQSRLMKEFDEYMSLDADKYSSVRDLSELVPICPVDESVVGSDEVLKQIYDFNVWMDKNFRYGLRINGKWDPKRNTTSEDWDKYLVVQSPEEIEKSKVGVCWDYVSYEAWYFTKHFPQIKTRTYYIQFFNGEDCPSHTILTFVWNGKHYYFENSFRRFAGLYEAKSELDIINYVLKLMSDNPDPSIQKGELLKKWEYDAWEYNALDHMLFGMHCQEYMNYVMDNGKCLHHTYSSPRSVKKISGLSINEAAGILDEVLFQDTDDTKYWEEDDERYMKLARKAEDTAKSDVAIDESAKLKSYNLVFLSQESDWNENVIRPRIPNNYMTQNGFEDNRTPRVCFSTSIDKALRALSQKCTGMELYVYTPDSTCAPKHYKIVKPTVKQVPDAEITDERWILEPVALRQIGKIKVIGDAGGPGLSYTYGNGQTAELFDWNWKWIYQVKEDGRLLSETTRRDLGYTSPELDNYKVSTIQAIANRIHRDYEKDKRTESGNQNCQLCTWAFELQCRGETIFPRPVYSPRDIVFSVDGPDIVIGPMKEVFSSRKDMIRIVNKAGVGSRFYVHVNWKNSPCGHEFIVMYIPTGIYLVDPQAGLVCEINDRKANPYFKINYVNSYMVRMDDKKVNQNVVQYNQSKYLTPWNENIDIQYMREHNMLSEAAIGEYKNGILRIPVSNTKYKPRVEQLIRNYHADIDVSDVVLVIRGKDDFIRHLADTDRISQHQAEKDFNGGTHGFVVPDDPLNVNIVQSRYSDRSDMSYDEIVIHECAHAVANSIRECDITRTFQEGIAIYESGCIDSSIRWAKTHRSPLYRRRKFTVRECPKDVQSAIQVRNIIKTKGYSYLIGILKGKNGLPAYGEFMDESATMINESTVAPRKDIWYHMVPKGTDMSKGIVSPDYMKTSGMSTVLRTSVDKYRDRLVSSWDIYPGRDPESLTDDDILDGLNKFRGPYGSRSIYLFRYPPCELLGPNMKAVLDGKDIYEVDLSKVKDIVMMDFDVNDGPGKAYYNNVRPAEYFATYDDDAEKHGKLLFAGIPHVSVATRSGRIPPQAIRKVKDFTLYHGSKNKHTVLKAQASPAYPNEKAVYGTPSYDFALAYAGGSWSDLEINQSIYNGTHMLTEILPGMFDKFFNCPGYIHHMHSAGFYPHSRSMEYVSMWDVKPYKIERIDNVLSALEKNGVQLYRYPELPPFIPDRALYIRRICDEWGLDADKVMRNHKINEAAGYILVDPSNKDMVAQKMAEGYRWANWKNRGRMQPMVPVSDYPAVIVKEKESTNPNDTLSQKAVDLTFYDEANNKIGMASISSVDTPTGFLYNVEVFPKYRGKGYGNAIVNYVLTTYSVNELTVEETNNIAISMYEKFGFKQGKKFKEDGRNMIDMKLPPKLNEAAVETHPMGREEKKNIADKYGLRAVGQTHDAAEADAAVERERSLKKREEERDKQLKKARRTKKHKEFIRKVKSHLPGVNNEEATAVDGSDADYLTATGPVEEDDGFGGKRVPAHRNPRDLSEFIDESSYSFKMLDHVQFFDRIDESAKDDNEFSPVYVVLIRGNSPVSSLITGFTGSEFTHASISFDSSLTTMYSFAGKNVENTLEAIIGGFKTENIKGSFYRENDISYAVYLVPSTKGAVKRMKKRLEYFIKNETKFRFDYLGLVKNFFHIPDDPKYTWFCSRFVADILNAGTPGNKLIDEPSLYRPEDFKDAEFAYLVGRGMAAKYNKSEVDRKTRVIMRSNKIRNARLSENSFSISPDNPYELQVLEYQLSMMDESTMDSFLQYLKSFKIRLDGDGNILITRREFDQLDSHFRESLRMIKTYENAGNVESVKDELCRINYMIELINQYYLREDVKNLKPNAKDVRKDMLDLRSVMMNAFRQHMQWVTIKDPKFNFQRYYDNHSKYGKNVMIPKKVVTAVGRTVITALA